MKQLLILSGKGGTGKTTVSAAFIKLSKAKAYADCDVDAPNLHLVTKINSDPIVKDYYSLAKAKINQDLCVGCGKCKEFCRFGAVLEMNEFTINDFACEGCSVCEYICPVNAITMEPFVAGKLMLYESEDIFSTAELKMGSGTTGMLVSEVKKQMKNAIEDCELAILDGSPGIGCPVIASISGVDMVLIVAEPSLSGISDMKRIINTVANFKIKTAVCINKADINEAISEEIKNYCKEEKIEFLGTIPYDAQAYKATNRGQTIVDIKCESGAAVEKIYNEAMRILL